MKISVKCHYGGEFLKEMSGTYEGKEHYWDGLDMKDISFSALKGRVQSELGHSHVSYIFYRTTVSNPTDTGLRALYTPRDWELFMKVAAELRKIEIYILHDDREPEYEMYSDVDYLGSEDSGDDDSSECSLEDEDLENLNDDELLTARRNVIAFKTKGNVKWGVNEKSFGIKRRGFTYNFAEQGTSKIGGEDDRQLVVHNLENSEMVFDERDVDFPPDSDSSSEEENDDSVQKYVRKKFPRYNPKCDMKNRNFSLHETFTNVQECRDAIRDYGCKNGYDIRFMVNDKKRVHAKCVNSDVCTWEVWASTICDETTFQIKTFCPVHQCGKRFKSRCCSVAWLAKMYHEKILSNPKWKVKQFKKEVLDTHGLDVSMSMCLRTRARVLGEEMGSLDGHYAKLWDYRKELKRRNEGSTIEIDKWVHPTTGEDYFDKIYICFGALKKGYLNGCRPVLGLDGCFLKGVCKGELLVAIGRDGNNQMFPVAWAVVQVENKKNWKWFIELLKEDLGLGSGDGWAVISDQHKGLMEAVHEILPFVEHRNCARHIYSNWKKQFKGGELRKCFWAVAYASNETQMQKEMDKLKEVDEAAYYGLMKRDLGQFCRAFFRTDIKVDNVENNMAEAFNGTIVEFRFKPIIYMLEEIRLYMMARLEKRRTWMMRHYDEYCPAIIKVLEKNKEDVKFWNSIYNGDGEFEVGYKKEGYVVNIGRKTCSCRRWQLSGIPCTHAIATILQKGERPEKYLDECYMKTTFLKAYAYSLSPINGEDQWAKSSKKPMLIQLNRKMPGRPRKLRIKVVHEEERDQPRSGPPQKLGLSRKGRVMRCRICNGLGHNKRGCLKNKLETGGASQEPVVGEGARQQTTNGNTKVRTQTSQEPVVGEGARQVGEIRKQQAVVGEGARQVGEIGRQQTVVGEGARHVGEIGRQQAVVGEGARQVGEIGRQQAVVGEGARQQPGNVNTKVRTQASQPIVAEGAISFASQPSQRPIVGEGARQVGEIARQQLVVGEGARQVGEGARKQPIVSEGARKQPGNGNTNVRTQESQPNVVEGAISFASQPSQRPIVGEGARQTGGNIRFASQPSQGPQSVKRVKLEKGEQIRRSQRNMNNIFAKNCQKTNGQFIDID